MWSRRPIPGRPRTPFALRRQRPPARARCRTEGSRQRNLPRLALLVALLTVGGAARRAVADQALGELELGGLVGVHLFHPDQELGRTDYDGPQNQLQPGFAAGIRLAVLLHSYFAIEGEAFVSPTMTPSKATVVVLGYRVHALVHFHNGRARPFLLLGYGALSTVYAAPGAGLSRDSDELPHGGLGLKIDLTPAVGLRVEARALLPPRIGDAGLTVDGELLVGVYGRLNRRQARRPADRDADGVMDDRDHCPDESGEAELGGCPRDEDGDGIADPVDRCPHDAGRREERGCPPAATRPLDPARPRDDEAACGDGSRRSQPGGCPALLAAGCGDGKRPRPGGGCPDEDDDHDGVLNHDDRCPERFGQRANSGCPSAADRDGDGIADPSDRCPEAAETRNTFEDEDGCPDELPVLVRRFTGVIPGIVFKSGSAVIARRSFTVLAEAARVLLAYPSVRLEIQDHTDDAGRRAKNLTRSQERAESVLEFLRSRGVDVGRLRALGYGPDRPLAAGRSAKARARNRRVEFQPLLQ